MDKVKQETFSNFHYEIIKSIDDRCADVKCTYTYKGKNLTHYFSYAKSGNKPNSYYINKAKADMNKIVASKSKDNVAKKDLNGKKATFFRRHKKPILIATTAVLVAGIATAATLVALKYLNKPNPEAVTEADIDAHLVFPKTELKTIYDKTVIKTVLEKAIAKIGEEDIPSNDAEYYYDLTSDSNIRKMTDLTIKRMGPFGAKVPDPFDYKDITDASEFAKKELTPMYTVNSGFTSNTGVPLGRFNDTTEFYTNESFKTKSLNSVYAKIDIKNNPLYTSSHIVNTYDEIVEGTPVKSVYLSDNIITQKKGKDETYKVFEVGKTTVDGVQTADLSSVLYGDGGEKAASECDDYINEEISSQVVYYADLDDLISTKGVFYPTFYQSGEKDVYAIYFEPYVTSVNIPSVYFPPIYDDPSEPPIVEGGVKGYISPRHIWHFVNDDKLGWILKSYAMDESTYTDYNDRYEKIGHAVSVNKMKGYVEFNYGERAIAKDDVDGLTIPELDPSEVEAPSLPVNAMRFACYDNGEGYNCFDVCELIDLTIPSRMSSENDSYVAAGTIRIPTQEDLDYWWEQQEKVNESYDVSRLHLQMGVGSVYFEESKEETPGKTQRSHTYPVQGYAGLKANDYFEISDTFESDSDEGPFIKLKEDTKSGYKALGHTFNVIVTYKNEPLQMYIPDGKPSGKTLSNWILQPTSITFNLVD